MFVIKKVPIDTSPVLSDYCALSVCNSPKRTPLNPVGGHGLEWYASREGQMLGFCGRGNELSHFIKYGLSLTR